MDILHLPHMIRVRSQQHSPTFPGPWGSLESPKLTQAVRAGWGHVDHLAQPPCFTEGETEAQRRASTINTQHFLKVQR